MSVINTDRDLETLLVDIRTRDLSDKDLGEIADALPKDLLIEALLRRALTEQMPASLNRVERISVLTKIFRAWEKVPELRLGQLIQKARRRSFCTESLFYEKDESLTSQIEAFIQEYTAPKA